MFDFTEKIYWAIKDRRPHRQFGEAPRLCVVNLPRPSPRWGIEVYSRLGWLAETDQEFGALHLLEHYLAGSIREVVTHPAHTNGHVGMDRMGFEADFHRDQAASLVETYLDGLFRPKWHRQDLLAYERDSILNEMNVKTHDLEYAIFRAVTKQRFAPGSRYGRASVESLDSTLALSLDDIVNTYKRWRESPLVVFLWGHQLPATLVDRVRRYLEACELKPWQKTTWPAVDYSTKQIELRPDPSIRGVYISLSFPAGTHQDPDRDLLAQRRLGQFITSNHPKSGFRRLREQGIYFFRYEAARFGDAGFWIFHSYCTCEQLPKTLGAIAEVWREVKKNSVPEGYLLDLKKESHFAIEREWYHNDSRYDWIVSDVLENEPIKTIAQEKAVVNSVTSQVISEVANRTLDSTKLNLTLTGDVQGLDQQAINTALEF